ncbi:hypothetical protein COLO4_14158 [Corchorus olitorius]|uniref:Uncharacterized protein n=1 Tax=Corchorus olitorius TaxID=93759 RepID=A0A1R3JTR7_9ROSI|nr:hypothetical protein COLO4_14158 [Corchorus olitorius]
MRPTPDARRFLSLAYNFGCQGDVQEEQGKIHMLLHGTAPNWIVVQQEWQQVVRFSSELFQMSTPPHQAFLPRSSPCSEPPHSKIGKEHFGHQFQQVSHFSREYISPLLEPLVDAAHRKHQGYSVAHHFTNNNPPQLTPFGAMNHSATARPLEPPVAKELLLL